MRAVIVDLDGTLSDASARDHHARNKDWDAFHELISEDPPHADVAGLLRILSAREDIEIIGCTGRSERFRKITSQWLIRHKIPMDRLLMRPEFDFRSDTIVKPELLEDWHRATDPDRDIHDRIAFILDDRDKMVEAWRALGFNCWQVRLGGY